MNAMAPPWLAGFPSTGAADFNALVQRLQSGESPNRSGRESRSECFLPGAVLRVVEHGRCAVGVLAEPRHIGR